MQGFDLEQLRTLVAVVDAGSLTAAAPRVFLSQSSVSEQMRKLEERAGQSLLTRSKAGVSPTEAGARLLVHARRILALSDEAFRDLQEQFNPGANSGESQQNEGRDGQQGQGQQHGQGGQGQPGQPQHGQARSGPSRPGINGKAVGKFLSARFGAPVRDSL